LGHERQVEDIVEVGDGVEHQGLADLGGDVLQVGLVLSGEDDLLDAGAVGAQDLLLDAADEQDAARFRAWLLLTALRVW
jgi:hypothetical protein